MSIENGIIERLAALAHTAPSADNAQPWRLVWDGTYLEIRYDSNRVTGKTFPQESPATLLSIGAVIEIVMATATDWQLSPTLSLCAALPTPDGLYAKIGLTEAGPHTHLAKEQNPASIRHTNRLAYLKVKIPASVITTLTAFSQSGARLTFTDNQTVIRKISAIVRDASKIRFQTEEVHQWLGRSLRFSKRSAASGDGMDVATLGLPPGGKLFLRLISNWRRMNYLNKLGVFKIVAAIDSAPIKAAPGLIAIIAKTDSNSTINAGRLLARSWIQLNQSGLAVHPYYVIADQLSRQREGRIPQKLQQAGESITKKSAKLFKLGEEETLHMLLRVGYAQRKPVLSHRLPLTDVYTTNTQKP